MWREHNLQSVPVFTWQSYVEALARKDMDALNGAVEPFQTHVHLVAHLVGNAVTNLVDIYQAVCVYGRVFVLCLYLIRSRGVVPWYC